MNKCFVIDLLLTIYIILKLNSVSAYILVDVESYNLKFLFCQVSFLDHMKLLWFTWHIVVVD